MTPSPTPDEQTRDPGLQPERTSLSWGRTLLALLVSDLLIWRAWSRSLSRHEGRIEGNALTLGLAAGTAAAATAVIACCVIYRTRTLRTDTQAPPAGLMLTTTTALLALAAATTVSILLTK
ncbi:Membrane protein [Sinomonas atrocyanea]|uniref:Membrane protein n=1 Tax=Sinomonas atrocyanea TaxID=37927 RepID=A0A127A6S6_9MICC|nr:DUF202 domain-containing protein [Sinomonas atrocyanea]AMM34494.1 Membrane protein [Sinomonas atrocyanea]